MKNMLRVFMLLGIVVIVFSSLYTSGEKKTQSGKNTLPTIQTKTGTYIVIAWNDLGMHCANKYFGKLAVLPPYNNQHAQIVKVGDSANLPQIVSTGFTVTYEIPGNTYSVGKTDFWTYANALFGVTLPNNIGLTGVGLTGNLSMTGNYFHVEGIPVTPYTDADLVNEHPYQLTLIKAYDAGSSLVATTQSVIPVSNELSCVNAGCHTSEQDILDKHEAVPGFNSSVTPILCADCHKDNALGMAGTPGTPSFSEAIHSFHADKTNDCYSCHPGPTTQCFRDVMKQHGMVCQDCHGTVANVANTIAGGREAWLQEPDCGTNWCHGSNYAPEPNKLYRNSKGHSDLYCSACHGSPHAILPTLQANDNLQNLNLQGYTGTLNKCSVCHGVTPTGPGPHGLYASVIDYQPGKNESALYPVYPNPVSQNATIPFTISNKTKVKLTLHDAQGRQVRLYIDKQVLPGYYTVSLKTEGLRAGVYICIMTAGEKSFTQKITILD